MIDAWLAVLFVVLTWWFATGVMLYLDFRPRHTFGWSMAGATVVAVASLATLVVAGSDSTPFGAFLSFAAAIGLWGWVEMSFLLGFVTGPRRVACAPGCSGTRHFVHAVEAIFYHEMAILAVAAVTVAATWDVPNKTGLWAFLILWTMRQSAKLNLFLGVRNTGAQLLPLHLRHLAGFFGARRMNALFPVSIAASTAVFILLVERAMAGGTAFDMVLYTLLATLMGLAIVEHLLMVLPLPMDGLWRWWQAARVPAAPAELAPAAGTIASALLPPLGSTGTRGGGAEHPHCTTSNHRREP